jgi:hypothetical protein
MQKAIDKLRKLLAQKRGEEALGNQAAAELFAAKIQELLIKHKLEFSDIDQGEEDRTNPILYRTVEPSAWGEDHLPKRVVWTEELCNIIAGQFFCQGLAMLESNCVMFVGREQDVEIAIEVFLRVLKTGLGLCEAGIAEAILAFRDSLDAKLWNFKGGNEDYRYSFFVGFNNAIRDRLTHERRRIEQAAGDSTALVRADQAVKDFVKDVLRPQDEAAEQVYRRVQRDAYNAGREYGSRVELRPDAAPNQSRAIGRLNGN